MKEREGSAKIYEGRGMGIWLNGWFIFFLVRKDLNMLINLTEKSRGERRLKLLRKKWMEKGPTGGNRK